MKTWGFVFAFAFVVERQLVTRFPRYSFAFAFVMSMLGPLKPLQQATLSKNNKSQDISFAFAFVVQKRENSKSRAFCYFSLCQIQLPFLSRKNSRLGENLGVGNMLHNPDLLSLVFFVERKDNHQQARIFWPREPSKSFEKKGKRSNKQGIYCKRQKQGIPKKQGRKIREFAWG